MEAASFPCASVCPTQAGAKSFERWVTGLGRGTGTRTPSQTQSPPEARWQGSGAALRSPAPAHARHQGRGRPAWGPPAARCPLPAALPGTPGLPDSLPPSLSARRKEPRATGEALAGPQSRRPRAPSSPLRGERASERASTARQERSPAAGHPAPAAHPGVPGVDPSRRCPSLCSRPAGLPAYMARECPGCGAVTIGEPGSPPLASRSWQREGTGRVPPRRELRGGERARNLSAAVPREGAGAVSEVGRRKGPPAAKWRQMLLLEDLPWGTRPDG
ncbi:translation initiation factor IF-2-like [Cricetulus griseus]|uniref:Translation initiation factor IF-2-like n=1 Tax=Cricetulus griseus TaxID=10029 RepID=A0A9J7GYJ3_CRIGR|nr:translation initiation factor IF-2-like [Cricetulus griseus]